jgi:hypothetical protein
VVRGARPRADPLRRAVRAGEPVARGGRIGRGRTRPPAAAASPAAAEPRPAEGRAADDFPGCRTEREPEEAAGAAVGDAYGVACARAIAAEAQAEAKTSAGAGSGSSSDANPSPEPHPDPRADPNPYSDADADAEANARPRSAYADPARARGRDAADHAAPAATGSAREPARPRVRRQEPRPHGPTGPVRALTRGYDVSVRRCAASAHAGSNCRPA